MNPHDRKPGIVSEMLEPTAAYVIGRMGMRCENASDPWELESACIRLWWAVRALDELAIAVETATHFSIAAGNELRRVAEYIECKIGVNPLLTKDPRFER